MTVQFEEPGLWVAYCDQCGSFAVLDLEADPDVELTDQLEAISYLGWLHRAPEKQKYRTGERSLVQVYPRDSCPDCQTDEPNPAPVFGAHRKPAARNTLDDPCDEWPRSVVWEAVGLSPACGHLITTERRCPQCEAGASAGENRPWWRRA